MDHPDTLHINRTLFILSGHFLDHPDSGHFPNHPDGHLSCHSGRLYGYFADHLDTFHIIQTLLGLFGHFADQDFVTLPSAHDHLLTRSQRADLALVAS